MGVVIRLFASTRLANPIAPAYLAQKSAVATRWIVGVAAVLASTVSAWSNGRRVVSVQVADERMVN